MERDFPSLPWEPNPNTIKLSQVGKLVVTTIREIGFVPSRFMTALVEWDGSSIKRVLLARSHLSWRLAVAQHNLILCVLKTGAKRC